jgi:hypothetical protein
VDLRAGLDDLEKRKSLPYRDSNSEPSVIQPVASRYIDYAIPAPIEWVRRDISLGIERLGLEAGNSPPSNAKVKDI